MFYKDYKRNDLGEIVTKENIDSYIPVLDDTSAQKELLHLQNLQNEINQTSKTWDDYSDSYQNGRGYLLSYAKEHDVLKASVDNIKTANIKARESTISYNTALQQQTLGAKASTLALKGLALVGNVVASVIISMIVSKAISFFYDLATAAKQAKESAESFASEFSSMQTTQNQNASTIANLSEEYESLSSHVDSLGRVTGLTTEETQRYHDICNQVAGIMPNLVQGYDDQGNAILSVKGKLSDLNKEYELYRKNEANTTYNQTDDKGKNVVDSVFKNYKNANNKLESMPAYEFDPFAKLDQSGVGKLVEMAVKLGKAKRPGLHLGICGEHGGEPSSIEFCHKLGLDYVSCSPFRVPIARLAAAQAAIKAGKQN